MKYLLTILLVATLYPSGSKPSAPNRVKTTFLLHNASSDTMVFSAAPFRKFTVTEKIDPGEKFLLGHSYHPNATPEEFLATSFSGFGVVCLTHGEYTVIYRSDRSGVVPHFFDSSHWVEGKGGSWVFVFGK